MFIAEGVREVTRALDCGLALHEFFICPTRADDACRSLQRRVDSTVQVCEVADPVLGKLAYRRDPQGVLAVFDQPRWRLADFEASPSTDDLWLVAVGSIKPGNVGAMARTASAAAASGLLQADAVVDAFNPNAICSSTGAVFSLPIIGGTGDEVLAFVRRRELTVLAADPKADETYRDADMTGPVAIVIGAEDRGLGDHWHEVTQARRVSIPIAPGPVDSLNASVAAAILLYEAARQRAEHRTC